MTEPSCNACSMQKVPFDVNAVTLGVAATRYKAEKEPIPEDLMVKLKEATLSKGGPGTVLKSMISWFSKPTEECQCLDHALTMNVWGVDKCTENKEEIVGWLIEEMEIRGMDVGEKTRAVMSATVTAAILASKVYGQPRLNQETREAIDLIEKQISEREGE